MKNFVEKMFKRNEGNMKKDSDVTQDNHCRTWFAKIGGFTLAEVLITLAVIGAVAAMTMPILVQNVQSRIKEKRIENIHQKLSKATDKMAVQSGLTGYGSTMDFVQELSKHMKLAKICDNNNIASCWPVKEVNLGDGKTWEIANTKTAKTLKIADSESWLDTVGIITADGTSMILSYNKNCNFDVDTMGLKFDKKTGKSNSLVCLSGVYDWNGGQNPNKLETNKKDNDIQLLGLASGLGQSCALKLDGTCFTTAFIPTPMTYAECEKEKDKLGIKECFRANWYGGSNTKRDDDYWAGAVKACGGTGNIPTNAQIDKLGKYIYNGGLEDYIYYTNEYDDNIGAYVQVQHTEKRFNRTNYNDSVQNVVNELGFSVKYGYGFDLWANSESGSGFANAHELCDEGFCANGYERYRNGVYAICIGID